MNGYKGSIIYSTGTGKTEIAYECARRAYEAIVHREQTSVSDNNNPFSILFLVPQIVLVQQNINILTRYGIPRENRSRIESMLIDSKSRSKERQKILSEWGKEFFPLLSVHTLEIGYDVPEVRVAIILATTSNMKQIVQRIGKIVRKTAGKETASIYTTISASNEKRSRKIGSRSGER